MAENVVVYAGREYRFKNENRIPAAQVLDEASGCEPGEKTAAATERRDRALTRLVMDGICPACCRHGCEVEPDGRCEHECPSLLIAMGLI